MRGNQARSSDESGRWWGGSWTDGGMRTRFLQRREVTSRLTLIGLPVAILIVIAIVSPLTAPIPTVAQEGQNELDLALERMNLYRSWLGLEPMHIDPALQAAAEAHAEYYRLNYGDPNLSGMGLHYETPGNPGFTGETMLDRARAQGYEGWVNENVGLSGSMLWSLDWFMGTINHRLPILDPRYTEVGLAIVNDGEIVFEIINFGMPEWQDVSEPEWTIWPPDGATGINRSFWGEAPNPFSGADFPTGVPITISFHGSGQLELLDWTLSVQGTEIPSFGSVGTGFLSSNTAFIASGDPLEPGVTVNAEANVAIDGEPHSFTWSFTTRSTDDEPIALNGESGTVASEDDDGTIDETPPDDPPADEPVPPDEPEEPEDPDPRVGAQVDQQPPSPPPVESDPNSWLPTGLQWSPELVQQLWWSVDGDVYTEEVVRSWLYGPDVWALGPEPYVEAPAGQRSVYYLDKARIEVNPAAEEPLTSGLLVRDMIAGRAQVGDDQYIDLEPAQVPIAGDALEFNPHAPTYASLASVASLEEGQNRVLPLAGDAIVMTLNSAGERGVHSGLDGLAFYGGYDETLGHNIALVFEEYFETLPVAWTQMVGLPLTEPYWIRTRVAGEEQWVLAQAFERRVLTYTPGNDPEWQVEMGNVGRHYYEWRYGIEAPQPVGFN